MDRAADCGMKIGRRGSGLAVRVSAKVVRELGLKQGDEVELTVRGRDFILSRKETGEAPVVG